MYHLFNVVLSYAAFCGVAFIILFVGTIIYNIHLHPLRHYPGPKSWSATRLAWAYSLQSGFYHHRLNELHERYGPIVRIAPNELSYIDARAWKDIYSTRPGHHVMEKNRVWAKHEPFSIISADEAVHTRNRRALMGAFTEHAVNEHARMLESYISLMMEKFRDAVEAGQGRTVVNMVDWLNFLAFDISGALSFGVSFDSVKNGKAHPWVEISCSFGKGVAIVAASNFFAPLNKLLQWFVPGHVMEKMNYHKELAKEKLMQRLEMQNGEKRQDYVGSITRYNQEKGETIVTPEDMEINMTILIFAGSETTSTAMAAILSELMNNPTALHKAEDEVRRAFRDETEITVASVGKLEYLTAIIQEAIRLCPPAAIALPRVVPRGGETICGQYVPGGTFVSLNQYPAFRSPTNFTRPDEFLPERFLDGGLEGDDIAVFEPFLVGRHKCIGQKLAWAEMRLVLARLLFAFEMGLAEEGGGPDFGGQRTYIFWEKRALRVGLRGRG